MTNPATRLTSALADRYRLERELGAGGMATVYLAQDLKHDRKVALKVLKPELAAMLGAERFVVEIKTTAALQHPHILPLFDSGTAEGFLYYVMPFIDGETLRGKLNRETQLSIDEAVRITVAVADALDYAHRHGVVHRDIKPENILLHDGRPMVADFGIALALSAAAGGRMTETGMSLGTPHYMSPEQATAEKELSPRSDIYSLGAVLYEMLTGNPPHVGASAQQIIMKIVTEDAAPVTRLRKSVPANVAAALSKSLEKLPADRFATAAEFSAALTNPSYTSPVSGTSRPHVLTSSRPGRALALVVASALLGAAATWALLRSGRTGAPVARFGLAFPDSQVPVEAIELSPDGARLVYNGPGAGNASQLWVKERNRYEGTPLPGTSGAQAFAISPDGRSVAFMQNSQLKRMSLSGGPVVTLADSMFLSGVAWLDDGTIIYTSTTAFELVRVPADGGSPTRVWKSPTPGRISALPTPLPGARGVIFTECDANCTSSDLWVLDLRTGGARRLLPGVRKGWYLPTRQLAYVGPDGAMFVVPFDLERLEIHGAPAPVQNGINLLAGILPIVTVSSSGTMVMQASLANADQLGLMDLVWVDRSGTRTPVDSAWTFHLSRSGSNVGWAIAPDGKRLVIGLNSNSGDDIWIKQFPAGPLSRVTFDSAPEQRPRWSPSGEFVTYVRVADTALRQRRADGTGTEQTILTAATAIIEGFWSHDGTWVVARKGGAEGAVGGRDIIGMRPGVDTAPVPLVANPSVDEAAPALSPDGKWLAYESDETGRIEVFIRPFPNTDGGKWQVSTNGGQAPLWAHSSREIFFVDGGRNMVATSVGPGSPLQLGERRALFRIGADLYLNSPEHYTPFDISRDDKRFLMARQVEAAKAERPTFLIVDNWFEELKAGTGAK